MARITYSAQAITLVAEINRRSLAAGADHFVMLRTSNGGSEVLRPADRYWLEFTRTTDGTVRHSSSVFATNPKDAVKWLEGYVSAVAWNFGKN